MLPWQDSLVLVSPRDAGAMDVTPLLMNCMSPDQNTRAAAEQQIEQAKVNNLVRPRQPAPLLAPLELTPPPAGPPVRSRC